MELSKIIAVLVEYFNGGCKQEQLLGLELEHFIIDSGTKVSLPYERGAEPVLSRLAPLYGKPVYENGRIIAINGENANITLEPAGQLEISINPTDNIKTISDIYNHFFDIISPILADIGCELHCAGYHPKSKIDDLPLIPKKRYELMYKHFAETGGSGKYMMKGTASTQINIDYESESDFIKKFRVANIFGPLFSFMYDNTPVFEGEPSKNRMIRTDIWNDVDAARSMVVPHGLDEGFGFEGYARYICGMPPILMPSESGAVYTAHAPVREIFKDKPLTVADIEHVLGMAFPDVRLKNRIEIRMTDSIKINAALEFTALVKNIFYNKNNLEKFYSDTLNIRNNDVANAKAQLAKDGENAVIYGKPAYEWLASF